MSRVFNGVRKATNEKESTLTFVLRVNFPATATRDGGIAGDEVETERSKGLDT